jgi:hypothetical protein
MSLKQRRLNTLQHFLPQEQESVYKKIKKINLIFVTFFTLMKKQCLLLRRCHIFKKSYDPLFIQGQVSSTHY